MANVGQAPNAYYIPPQVAPQHPAQQPLPQPPPGRLGRFCLPVTSFFGRLRGRIDDSVDGTRSRIRNRMLSSNAGAQGDLASTLNFDQYQVDYIHAQTLVQAAKDIEQAAEKSPNQPAVGGSVKALLDWANGMGALGAGYRLGQTDHNRLGDLLNAVKQDYPQNPLIEASLNQLIGYLKEGCYIPAVELEKHYEPGDQPVQEIVKTEQLADVYHQTLFFCGDAIAHSNIRIDEVENLTPRVPVAGTISRCLDLKSLKIQKDVLKKATDKLIKCVADIKDDHNPANGTGNAALFLADGQPLTRKEWAKIYKCYKRLQSCAQRQGHSDLQLQAGHAKRLCKLQWAKYAELDAQTKRWRELKAIDVIGASMSDSKGANVNVSGGLPIEAMKDLSPSASGSLGVSKTNEYSIDDEELCFLTHDVRLNLGGSLGIGKRLAPAPTVTNPAAQLSGGTGLSGSLSVGGCYFKEWTNMEELVIGETYKTGWANPNADTAKGKFKTYGYKAMKWLKVGSKLKDLKNLQNRTMTGVAGFNYWQDSELAKDSEYQNAVGNRTVPERVTIDVPRFEQVEQLDSWFTAGSASGSASIGLDSRFGDADAGFKLGASASVGASKLYLDIYQWIPIQPLDMLEMDPAQLRQIPDRYSIWLRRNLGVADDTALKIHAFDDEHEVNNRAVAAANEPATIWMLDGPGDDVELTSTTAEGRITNSLVALDAWHDKYVQARNLHQWCLQQKTLTRSQQQLQALCKRIMSRCYRNFGVASGHNEHHKVLRNMSVCMAFLKDQINNNPSVMLDDSQKKMLSELEAKIRNPQLEYSPHFLSKLTDHTYVARLKYNYTSISGNVDIGPLGADVVVTRKSSVHPNCWRNGDFIDFTLSGSVKGGIQKFISGADIGKAITPLLAENGIDNVDLSAIADVTVEGKWSLTFRVFKPSFRSDPDYDGPDEYRVQMARQSCTTTIGGSLGASAPVGPVNVGAGVSASTSLKLIERETLGTEDIVFPCQMYLRMCKRNNWQPGSVRWEKFVQTHKSEFEEIFKHLGNPQHKMWCDIHYFFKTELLNAKHLTPEKIAENKKLYHYMHRVMGEYKANPTDDKFDECRRAFDHYCCSLGKPWWRRHMANWQERQYQGSGTTSPYQLGDGIRRFFKRSSNL